MADFLSHWKNRSNWSNLRLNMSISALGRLKNHKIPRLHPNFRMCMPLNRHQLKMYAFPVKTQCLFQMRTFTVNQNLSRFYAPLWRFYAPLSRFYATNSDFYSEKTGDDSDFTQNFWENLGGISVNDTFQRDPAEMRTFRNCHLPVNNSSEVSHSKSVIDWSMTVFFETLL